MRKVIWLPEAIDDLVRLREFIGDKNREAANRAVFTIKNMAKILEDYPDIIHPLKTFRIFMIWLFLLDRGHMLSDTELKRV